MNGGHWKTTTVILLVLILPSMSLAGSKGKGSDGNAMAMTKKVTAHVSIFLEKDRDLIRRYLAGYGIMPPGLAKRHRDLPPGLERQLRRNGHLPPGLDKKLHRFPLDLERRLSPLRPGLIRAMIGVHAVILDPRTSLILDVFKVF